MYMYMYRVYIQVIATLSFCIVLCCIYCDSSPCHLSHLGSSVAEHLSREQSVVGSKSHLRQLMLSRVLL